MPHRTFVAIDFETCHHDRNSACSIAMVRVERGRIVDRQHHLIRPPRRSEWMFTHVHGIRPADVARAPQFGEVWPRLARMLKGAQGLVAHNAPFDRGVLVASCRGAGLPEPTLPFHDSVRGARRAWRLPDAKLGTVCRHLGIALDHHHDALCDAEAAARVWLAVVDVLGEEAWQLAETAVPSASGARAQRLAGLAQHAAGLVATAGRSARKDPGVLLDLLRAAGGRSGNIALRDALNWDKARYEDAKRALIDAGKVVPGPGRGGTLRVQA